jgi:16S rRNA (adenine(1408)-N(1))-methyltransferase
MESIRGRQSLPFDAATLGARLRPYSCIWIDIGTGDGRYVHHIAHARPDWFVLGIDACRENLRAASRQLPDNALYLIANACALPGELYGVATHLTINFPWGSLLAGLLSGEPSLLKGVAAIARPGACIDVRLNRSALTATGRELAAGASQVRHGLLTAGFHLAPPAQLSVKDLRCLPTTWAKRLAFGREAGAVIVRGRRLTT